MDKLRGIVAKIFVIVLFGLLILSFAIWGIGDMLRQHGDKPVVAEVGSQEITEQVYRREMSETMNILSRRIGSQVDMQMAQSLGLPQQVLQRLITDKLITEEARQRGLIVTDTQVRDAIYANPAFRGPDGKFDRSRYEQTLFQAQLSEAGYVADLREQLLQQQLTTALGAAIEPPALLVDTLYRREAEQRRADWVEIKLADQPEVALPDDATLKAYYDKHSDAFMAPAYRSVSFVWLKPEDLMDEVSIDEKAVQAEYKNNLEAYVEPETRTLEQAVYDSKEAAEAAYKRVEAGEDYAKVVKETTKADPVPLGTVAKSALPPVLRDVAFGSKAPGVLAPVESSFGWHLIKVEAIKDGEHPDFATVKPKIEAALKRRQAVDALVSIVNQLDDELGGGATLDEAAKKLNLKLRKIPAVDRQGTAPDGTAVTPLPAPQQFLKQAFETAVGEQSLVLETEQNGYFVLRVDGETPAKPKPFEAVRDQVGKLWQKDQEQAEAWKRADALQKQLDEGQTLSKVAEAAGLTVTEGKPVKRDAQEPSAALVQALFDAKKGKSVTAEGPDGPIVAVLQDIQEPDPAKAPQEVAQIRENLTKRMRGDLFDLYLRALQQRHGVQVYQNRIDQVLAGL
ncbi:peptidyl-prolyl cis-trans isomerase D [Tistlia consotensis]|uniref:Parvulin-like PPIase n=1 Tax=Tistlia consotensis USBA 355 TaxID=560819 RepID=A0A1Y6CSA2_9PROT|nr:SurA N-terminal domain-containing protein [Tistlia consotensis]SMF69688.1 peptidyl-prolyl cis-trans isomerase D [Tistlia consotensis USBA 355]SNS05525.1 peptidyl-prolyl cis-trans isomerase D [Tistlia consotensis]